MVWSSLQVSYFLLAPMSVLAGTVLIGMYCWVKELRKRPGWLILWQCIAQTLLDLHWLSSSDIMSHEQHSGLCEFIGTTSIYAYLLACNYTVCLSYFIIRHLRRPLRSERGQKLWSLHAVCHGTAAAAALAVLASDSVGTSIMTTCFIQSGTKAEYSLLRVLLIVPLSLYAPLCLSAAFYSLRQYRTHFLLRRYIVKHTWVVITFSACWFFPALIHLLNEPDIDEAKNQPVLADIAMIAGAISGFLTVIVRLLEPGFLCKLVHRKANNTFFSGFHSPQLPKNTIIEITARKRAGSFPSLYSSQAMVQNAQQFGQSLLIALHFCFIQYQDLEWTYGPTAQFLDLEVLRRDGDLYAFTKDHSNL